MKDQVLAEAKRLYGLGFGVLLLHPKSKRPKENGWTTGDRSPWTEIEKKYVPGDNVGVRLGEASKIGDKYLACIDVDVKDPAYKDAAMTALKDFLGDAECPEVLSGAGNGSRHLYCVTPKPFKMITVKKEKGWEICAYSTGRQMVLSPSVHPVTGERYKWARPLSKPEDLPTLDFEPLRAKDDLAPKSGAKDALGPVVADFEFIGVELAWLPISDKIRNMILTGEGVTDRSAMLLPVCHALTRAGLSRGEILSVLTEPSYYLAAATYEHAKTRSRKRAAAWLDKYTLQKVLRENSAELMFREPLAEATELSFDEMEDDELRHWTADLDLTKDDNYKTSLKNTFVILSNLTEQDDPWIKRDVFAYRDFYTKDVPWGGKKDEAIGDDDVAKIKLWLSENYGLEPSNNTIEAALTILATDNAFDPVTDWLSALPEWDQVERLNGWLKDNFEAKGNAEYLAQVFRKWIFGMVLRVLQPGAEFSWMPIFEGAQGVGKSSFGRILVGDKFFLDWLPDLSNKDSALALQGIWAVEMGELASFRKNEIETVKAFITRKVDKVRPPFGRRWVESPRRCVFFGTTNYETYLRDDSGNRRFKPVKVGRLNFSKLEEEREQLFAEALWLYKTGFESQYTTELTGEAKVFEKEIQAEKMVQDNSDLMAELLANFIEKNDEKPPDEKFDFRRFKMHQLFDINQVGRVGRVALPGFKFGSREVQDAAKALKKLGFRIYTVQGKSMWGPSKEET